MAARATGNIAQVSQRISATYRQHSIPTGPDWAERKLGPDNVDGGSGGDVDHDDRDTWR